MGAQSALGRETLLAWRDAADGPWVVAELAQRIHEKLADADGS